MSAIEIDPKKIKPYFQKKMEDGMLGEFTTDFMIFSSHAFTQSEQVRDNTAKYGGDLDTLTEWSKQWNYQVLQSNIMEVDKIQALINKLMEYTTLKT